MNFYMKFRIFEILNFHPWHCLHFTFQNLPERFDRDYTLISENVGELLEENTSCCSKEEEKNWSKEEA